MAPVPLAPRLPWAATAVGVALLGAVGTWAAWRFAVQSETGRRLESLVTTHAVPAGWSGAADHLLALTTTRFVAVGLVVAVVVAAVRRRPVAGALAVAVVVGANGAGRVLKHDLLGGAVLPDGSVYVNSGPSGHTIAAASLAVALVLVVPPRVRPSAGLLAALWSAAVGVSTVLSGAHRPSDAVGGLALVLAVAAAGCAVAALVERPRPAPRPARWWGLPTAVLGVAALVCGVLAAVVLAPLARAGAAEGLSAGHDALVGAVLAVAASAAAMAALVGWVRGAAERAATPVEAAPGTRPARHRH